MIKSLMSILIIILCLSHCGVNTGTRIKLHGVKYILDIDNGKEKDGN
jgi:hypothetical protein